MVVCACKMTRGFKGYQRMIQATYVNSLELKPRNGPMANIPNRTLCIRVVSTITKDHVTQQFASHSGRCYWY